MSLLQKQYFFHYLICFLFIFPIKNCFSQKINTKLDSIPSRLSEVLITGNLNKNTLLSASETIQIINSESLNYSDKLNYTNILNRIPGVFMHSGSLNTNRISIRGIGARSPFATTGIRAYFGEIPLTNGNGISAIEDFELANISSIEVHKGPAASSFGVGLGGTIILNPTYVEKNTASASLNNTYGSFNLLRTVANIKIANNNTTANFVYSNTQSDGYRDNNNYNRQTITTSVKIEASKKDNLLFLGNYTDLKAFIPSSVNLETYNNNPKSAAPAWEAAKGFEDAQSLLTGLSWEHSLNRNTKIHSSIFASSKKNNEPSFFNILNEKTNGAGLRSRITGKLSNKLDWGFGGELFLDKADYTTYDNLYEDFPEGTGSVKGQQISELEEQRMYYNIFGETSYEIHSKWILNTGFNINQTSYKIEDTFNIGTNNTSGNFNFKTIFSPKLGLIFNPNNHLKLKASVAHGFAPPTTEETLLPDGIINNNLRPEKGWNFEVGSQFSILENKLTGDLNLYALKVTDLLVNRRSENDELFAINAGKTSHLGIEGNLNYRYQLSKKITINSFINFSIYEYSFNTFIDETNDYSGNDLTGVPSSVFNAGLVFITKCGLYGNINHQYIASIPANDANTVYSNSYQLVNTKVGYQIMPYKKLKIDTYFGVNNIFNKKYVSQLQVNASGFGGNAPRYYYAGNPVNYYGGITISYVFL